MLKRKHSTDSFLTQTTKRLRTFSEPQLDTQITVIPGFVPRDNGQAATQRIENPHPLRLNSLLGSNQPSLALEYGINKGPLELQFNPLWVANDEIDKLSVIDDTSNGLSGPFGMCPDDTEPPHNPEQQVKDRAASQPSETVQSSNSSTSAGLKEPSEIQHVPNDLPKGSNGSPASESVFHPGDIKMGHGDVRCSEDLYVVDPNEPLQPFNTSPVCGTKVLSNEVHISNMGASQSIEQPVVEQPITEQPVAEQPVAEQPVVGQSGTGSSHQTPITELEQGQCSIEDQQFVDKVKAVLKTQGKWKTANVGRRSARRIGQLLELAKPPNTSEALFLSGDDAAKQVECGNYFSGPIITEDQQPLPLQTTTQFLNEFYDDTVKVWIQDPAILLARNVPHAREIPIGQLKQRFLQFTSKGKIPWNCLEMATHVEDGLRPSFLNNEDCRLLTKLKLPSSGYSVSRRGYEPGWKEVEKWALLAQGGALTEPHQDSHGYSTYITVNQGTMGLGWLSNPTAEERLAWRDKAATFTGGRWRYVVLRPGQTVFFPSGTVHFVFRLASLGDTLAFGGHVLRCSQIVRWIESMLEEKTGRHITNEDLTVSALAYLERVEKFVNQARKTGQVERWGGAEAIDKFLQLKAEFMSGS